MKKLITALLLLGAATWCLAQNPVDSQLPEDDIQAAAESVSEDEVINEILREISNELDSWSEEDRENLVAALENLSDIDIDFSSGPGETLIAIVAITFSLGMPIIIIGIVSYASYRKKKLIYQTISEYASSGRDVPPEILKLITSGDENQLHGGMIMTGVGVGVIVLALVIDAEPLIGIGAILLCIGLAKLLIWKLDKKKEQAPNTL